MIYNCFLKNIIIIEKNIPLEFIEKYSYKLNYFKLSKNPNLTEKFILKYPYQKWNIGYLIKNNKITNFSALSKFKYLNIKNIIKYLDKPWDWEWIIENDDIGVEKHISLNLLEKYKNKWNCLKLSFNPNLTEEFILKYPYQNWDIEYLIENNKITNFNALSKFKNINQNIINKYLDKSWDWEWLIENTNINIEKYIPFELIKKYNYKWDCYQLSYNPNLTKKFILKYPYKKWNIGYLIKNNKITNFNALSKFKYLSSYVIDEYPDKPWDWEWLIENKNNISKNTILYEKKYDKYRYCDINYIINTVENFNKFEIIIQNINKYPDKSWDWEWIIENTNIKVEKYISIELINIYKYKWNYRILSYNPNLTEEFILKYPYQNWNINYLIKNNKITDFNSLSKFKNINNRTINKYPDKPWDWEWLIENTNIHVENYIPFNLIEKYSYKWNYWDLSYNPNLTKKFILKYPYKKWNIRYLIKNNKITNFNALSKFKYIDINIIYRYLNKPWNLIWLNKNSNWNIYLTNNKKISIRKNWKLERLIKMERTIRKKRSKKNKKLKKQNIKKYFYSLTF